MREMSWSDAWHIKGKIDREWGWKSSIKLGTCSIIPFPYLAVSFRCWTSANSFAKRPRFLLNGDEVPLSCTGELTLVHVKERWRVSTYLGMCIYVRVYLPIHVVHGYACMFVCVSSPVWPDAVLKKVAQVFPIVALNNIHSSFYIITWSFSK